MSCKCAILTDNKLKCRATGETCNPLFPCAREFEEELNVKYDEISVKIIDTLNKPK